MSGFWDSVRDGVKSTAQKAGSVAVIGANRTKLRTEIVLVDRDIRIRQETFGIELYNLVEPTASTPEFYALNNDRLTQTLRPPLLKAQREIAALQIRVKKLKEQMAAAEVKRAGAFPTPAATWGERVVNAGKSAHLAGNETKLKTEMVVVETQIKGHKQAFGVEMFAILVKLEDENEWLPTDRNIRALYDQARQDVENLKQKRKQKEQELIDLGGSAVPEGDNSYDSPSVADGTTPDPSTVASAPSPETPTDISHVFSSKSAFPPTDSTETPIVYATTVPAPAPSTTANGSTNASSMFGAFPAPSTSTRAMAAAATLHATGNVNAAAGMFSYPGAPSSTTTTAVVPTSTTASTSAFPAAATTTSATSANNNNATGMFSYPGSSQPSTDASNSNAMAPVNTNIFATPAPTPAADPFADLLS